MIITNKFLSNSKTGRKNNMAHGIDVQFEYILKEIDFYCKDCNERIKIKADSTGNIKERNTLEYKCKCGNIYKIPNHYVNTYHNKKTKIISWEE